MTVLSPLARGRGTWTGDLESTHSLPVPVLKPYFNHDSRPLGRSPLRSRSDVVRVSRDGRCVSPSQEESIHPDFIKNPHTNGLHSRSLQTKISSRPSNRHWQAKSESMAGRGDGQLDLPKTYLTRKGALMLFAGQNNMAFSQVDQEKYYFYDPEDVANQTTLREMGTLDKLTASVFQYVNQQQVYSKRTSPRRNAEIHTVSCSLEDADLRTQPGADFHFYLKNVQSQASFRNLLRSPSFRSLLSSDKGSSNLPTTIHSMRTDHVESPSIHHGNEGGVVEDIAATSHSPQQATEDTGISKEGDSVMNGNATDRPSTGRFLRSTAVTPLSFKEITASIKSAPYHGRPRSAGFPATHTPFIPTPPCSLHDVSQPSDVEWSSSQQWYNVTGSPPRHSAQSQRSAQRPKSDQAGHRRSSSTSVTAGNVSATCNRSEEFDCPAPSRRVSAHSLHGSPGIKLLHSDIGMGDDMSEVSIRSELVRSSKVTPRSRQKTLVSAGSSVSKGSWVTGRDALVDDGEVEDSRVTPRSRQRSLVSAESRMSKGSWVTGGDASLDDGEVEDSGVTPRSRQRSLVNASSRMSQGTHAIEDAQIGEGRVEDADDDESDWRSEVIDLNADDDVEWGVEQQVRGKTGGSSGMGVENNSGNATKASRAPSRNLRRIYTPKSQSSGRTTPFAECAGDGAEMGDGGRSEDDGRMSTPRGSSRNSQRIVTPAIQISDRNTSQEELDVSSRHVEEKCHLEVVEGTSEASFEVSKGMYIPRTSSPDRNIPMGEVNGVSGGTEGKTDVEEEQQSSRALLGDRGRTNTPGSSSSGRSTSLEEPTDSLRPPSGGHGASDFDKALVDDNIQAEEETVEVPLRRSNPGLLLDENYDETVVPIGVKQPVCLGDIPSQARLESQDASTPVHPGESITEYSTMNSKTAPSMTKPKSPIVRKVDKPLKATPTDEPTETLQQEKRSGTLTVYTVPKPSPGADSKHHQPSSQTTNLAFVGYHGEPQNAIASVSGAAVAAGSNKGRKSPVRSAGKKNTSFRGPQFEYVESVAIDPYAARTSKKDVEDMVAQELARDLSAQNLLEDKKGVGEDQKDEVDSLATDDEAIEAELKNSRPTTSSKKKENRKKLAKEKAALREARRAEKQRRREEMGALREKKRLMEEERRRIAAEAKRRQEELAERIAEAEQEAEMARQAEEDAKQMMQEARRVAREGRDARRKEDAEKRRLEREQQRGERKKMEELARQREKEMADRLASAEDRRAVQEEARLEQERRERLEQEERDRLEEEEEMKQDMQEERIREMERQAEREAMVRLVRERETAEENRRQAEVLMKQKREEEERKRQEELELRAKEEARLLLLKIEEEQRMEMEQEKIRQIQQLEEEARAKVRRELGRRRAVALRRRERNLEQRGHMNGLRRTQGMTEPWVFTYYVHWPRDSYERRLPAGDEKKRRRPRAKTAPPLTAGAMALVADSASAP